MAAGDASVLERTVYVGRLPVETSAVAVQDFFSRFGTVAEVEDPGVRPGARGRFFYVVFSGSDEAKRAVAEANGQSLVPGGEAMQVQMRRPRVGADVERGEPDPKTVWVGALPAGKTEEEIAALFGRAGTVVNVFPRLRARRPWAFVEMSSAAEAEAAVAALHGHMLPGATEGMVVEVQRAGKPVSPLRGEVREVPAPASRVWVGGFGAGTTREDIRDFFAAAGEVTSVKARVGEAVSRPYAHVNFASEEEAAAAVSRFNGQSGLGGDLVVEAARPTRKRVSRRGPGGGAGGAGAGGAGGRGKKRSSRPRPRSDDPPNPCRVWVGGIDPETNRDDVMAFFGDGVTAVHLRGHAGWVLFDSEAKAQAAIARSGQQIKGNTIEVQPSSTPDVAILRSGRRRRGPRPDGGAGGGGGGRGAPEEV